MAEQPQGTEYTLQGVMRFLQIEWHNHERARNTWDIERAEMKAKIAKQEGDCRSAKKINESLERQITMLEKALRAERAKNKAGSITQNQGKEDIIKREWKGEHGTKGDMKTAHNGSHHNGHFEVGDSSTKQAQRDRSKLFLQRCLEELTYLLTPPAYPSPPQQDPLVTQEHKNYVNQQDMPSQMEEMYMEQQNIRQQDISSSSEDIYMQQQQQAKQQQQYKRSPHAGASHLPSLPNHHAPPQRAAPDRHPHTQSSQHSQQPSLMSRQNAYPPSSQQASSFTALDDDSPELPQHTSGRTEDQVEKIIHTFDSYGRAMSQIDEKSDASQSRIVPDSEGWNFDDTSTLVDSAPELLPALDMGTDHFFSANQMPPKSPSRTVPGSHRRKSSGSVSMARRRSENAYEARASAEQKAEATQFKVRFALRGHLDVIRSIIFTGGGSPSEPEICTTGDDGMIKRWIIPANYANIQPQQTNLFDLDIQSYFTHRGHEGIVTSLSACPASASFSTGGRALGDGWIFSGGQDSTVRVWERGRVDPKATLHGHTDAVWCVCVLSGSIAAVCGQDNSLDGSINTTIGADRILLASGAADHTVKIWAVSAPPQLSSPQNIPGGARRGVGGSRRHSVTSGSGFPSSPQPSTASDTPFNHELVHSIEWPSGASASPTCICSFGSLGESFVVSYSNAGVCIFDTRTGEAMVTMASNETYDGSSRTGVNTVLAVNSTSGFSGSDAGASMNLNSDTGRGLSEDDGVGLHGATGSAKQGGVEGTVITGHEDQWLRFFDANSGQCTYHTLAHPSSVACLSLSPDGRELVSAGHDASLRFWSLEKRNCVQEITSHRLMRGEGVVSVVWSQDGRWVVSGGGDGVVKVFSR